MLIATGALSLGAVVPALILALVSVWTWRWIKDPLRDIPGPFWSRFTRLWELSITRAPGFVDKYSNLHRTYGPIVRLAPNRYSISDPQLVEKIYAHGTRFAKGPFYHAFGPPDPVDGTTFSERSIERHAVKRRKVSSLYSMSTLLTYEQFVQHSIFTFEQKLEKIARSPQPSLEVGNYMQFYAFDVIGEITVGQPFGFIEAGHDFDGTLRDIRNVNLYGSRIGLVPELHAVIFALAKMAKRPSPLAKVWDFIEKNTAARKNGDLPTDRNDFLSKLLDLEDSGKIDHVEFLNTMGGNIVAGSDTTAISLTTIIYHLAKNPDALLKLRQEIREFESTGRISNPVRFTESQKMPYLQAVIKEGLRIHPAVGQMLTRVVPPGGATIGGRFFPEGVEVGTSPWLTHFDKEVFGEDADQFNPDRWLESAERSTKMDRHILTFGAGARTCLGKNISILEMNTLVPQLYRKFNFVLENPDQEWEVEMVWFVRQKFNARIELLKT